MEKLTWKVYYPQKVYRIDVLEETEPAVLEPVKRAYITADLKYVENYVIPSIFEAYEKEGKKLAYIRAYEITPNELYDANEETVVYEFWK